MSIAALDKKVRFWLRATKVCWIVTATAAALLLPLGIIVSIAIRDSLPLGTCLMLSTVPFGVSIVCMQTAANNVQKLAVLSTGIEISGARVVKVHSNTPCDKAGFKIGDVILRINSKDTNFSKPDRVHLDLYEEFKTNLHTVVAISRDCKLEVLTLIKS